MSDHSKPRRWTLVGRTKGEPVDDPRIEVLEPTRGPFTGHLNTVPVREDCITTEDVEAVAIWLFEMQNAGLTKLSWDTIADPGRDLWRLNARSLLAHIFEGGEQ